MTTAIFVLLAANCLFALGMLTTTRRDLIALRRELAEAMKPKAVQP